MAMVLGTGVTSAPKEHREAVPCQKRLLRAFESRRHCYCLAMHSTFAPNNEVFSMAGSLHLTPVASIECVSCRFGGHLTSIQPRQHLKYQTHGHLRSFSFPRISRNMGFILATIQYSQVRALPLQAVTTDNDSDGSTTSSSSTSWAESSCMPQANGEGSTWKSFVYFVQVWYFHAKSKLLCFIKDLRSSDVRHTIKNLNNSKVKNLMVQLWNAAQPWIKWPVAIYLPWFLLINVLYGMPTSIDLLPLWIIGPIVTGFTIRSTAWMWGLCRQQISVLRLQDHLIYAYEDLKAGRLPGQVVEFIAQKLDSKRSDIVERWSSMMHFVRSGEFIVVIQKYFHKRLMEFWEVSIDKYEDMRLYYYYIERNLKNII